MGGLRGSGRLRLKRQARPLVKPGAALPHSLRRPSSDRGQPCRSPSRSRWTRSRPSTSTATAPSRWRWRRKVAAMASTTICRASSATATAASWLPARPFEVRRERGNHVSLGDAETIDLATMDVVLMRQDPPFNLAYISATHLLDRVHPQTLVVNDPHHVRNAPEKLFVTQFAELMPPTLITYDLEEIKAFRREYQRHHRQAALRQWRRRRVPSQARRHQSRLAGRAVRDLPQRALDGAALRPGDPPGRQADHPGRRQARRRGQPRAGGARRPAPTCMSAAGPRRRR